MATICTTMAMDAMIDSLKLASVSIEEVTLQTELLEQGIELPPLKPMVLSPSTLCWACKNVLDRGNKQRISTLVQRDSAHSNDLAQHYEELPHHSLENLALEATRGCHLCLVVYLGLDTEELKKFARTLVRRDSATEENNVIVASSPSDSSIGFVSIISSAHDQAKLRFRYIKVLSAGDFEHCLPVTYDAQVKSSVVANFDFANYESQRASIGYCFESPGKKNRPISYGPLVVGTQTSGQDVNLFVELNLLKPQRVHDLGIRTMSTKSVCTASRDSLELARGWIRKCDENHIKCGATGDANWKPTYLLDVTIRDSNNIPGIQLVDSMSLDRSSEYVTLSHSWGTSKPIRLNKWTLAALRQGVAQSSVSKTFAEASMIARKLGYRYLWIDALCIMHDSEKAVLDEVSQMHKIYGNAALNIAATCAFDDTEGFIRPRNVTALQPCVLDVQGHDIDDGIYMAVRTSAWSDLVDKAPLQRRAWALQERALAKRTLHFTRSELMWECQQMCCSETHPQGMTADLQRSKELGVGQRNFRAGPRFDKQLHHLQTGNWGHLVELFSEGKLSYQSDKLLALSGLARQYLSMNGLTPSDYVVGLWRTELPHCLLWKVEKGQRLLGYRAPSWSWASTDGFVKYSDIDHVSTQPCLEIIDISTSHQFEDVLGICQNARLRVRGFLTRGLLQRKRDYWCNTSCSIQCPKARVRIDFQNVSFDEELPQSMMGPLEVYILPVVSKPSTVEGLLLTATEVKGELKRLGVFALSLHNNRTNCEKLRSAMNEEIGLASYEERLETTDSTLWFAGTHKYVVTLV